MSIPLQGWIGSEAEALMLEGKSTWGQGDLQEGGVTLTTEVWSQRGGY